VYIYGCTKLKSPDINLVTSLLEFVRMVKLIYLNFSNDFDIILHELLPHKSSNYGSPCGRTPQTSFTSAYQGYWGTL
jgi:hypothetical protein